MSFNQVVRRYVVATAIAAVAMLVALSLLARRDVDLWALFTFALVGCILEISRTSNKNGALNGSLVFVFHLSIGLVLGGFWGAATAAVVRAIAEITTRRPIIKIVFNVAERVLSVGITFLLYQALGGQSPPDILISHGVGAVPFDHALGEVVLFLCAAVTYFITNSMLVNAVVAFASGRSVLSTWRANTVWVLGYDVAASIFALPVAWVFLQSNSAQGAQRFLFLIIVLPLAFARHIYGRLNEVQNLYGELDSAYEQLELNVREQLAMMVKAIEARDPYTSGHSRRVCGLSRAIAVELGLPPEEVENIENAALLHDVGKIHAEFAPLLQKQGPLTDDEWAVMKTHSARSAELVGLFSRFQGYVVSCVRHHHERWDGRGYPDGVAGADIPLGARIITIADTIDAMTTSRPYRDALPIEAVLNELNRCRGTQFEASLIELTVNSVTVRRLISDPSLIPEMPAPKIRERASQARRLVGANGGNASGR